MKTPTELPYATVDDAVTVTCPCGAMSWHTIGKTITPAAEALSRRAPDPARLCRCGCPATTNYEMDFLCEACAREDAHRDMQENEMPGGFGE